MSWHYYRQQNLMYWHYYRKQYVLTSLQETRYLCMCEENSLYVLLKKLHVCMHRNYYRTQYVLELLYRTLCFDITIENKISLYYQRKLWLDISLDKML